MNERVLAGMRAVSASEVMRLVRVVREMVDLDPEISGRDVLVRLEALADEAVEQTEAALLASEPDHAECAKCGKPIETTAGDRERWVHSDSDRSRGCRAATFTENEGWNDEIPRTWKAQPKKR
ncbi:hypothetical protein LO762_29905 [Actinocorallia sp. API 0066]|uniref:hypothetical protein n=1 Tax=Actinocorallia sp. API 0066 TaxID=2896846 RepID=UPI001E3F9562|nr:hypothetical protein [Actinocorallia sp. API 0066]MCD0453364.1 hypothetical protein [Actinocorallia sp. API 0066]